MLYDPSSMGKRHDTPPASSSKTTMAVMIVGALLVAGLVGWALTRTVEPASTVATETSATTVMTSTTATTAVPTTAPPVTADFSTAPAATATADFNPATTPLAVPPEPVQEFKRIAVEDLRAKVNRNAVVVVDVRDQGSYQRSHIPGAIHIPLASVEANLGQLPKDREIVAYCTCPNEESSGHAAQILAKNGYTNVSALYGGLGSWESLGYPTKSGPTP
jgi:rhodanese-related sulfurtransferase